MCRSSVSKEPKIKGEEGRGSLVFIVISEAGSSRNPVGEFPPSASPSVIYDDSESRAREMKKSENCENDEKIEYLLLSRSL